MEHEIKRDGKQSCIVVREKLTASEVQDLRLVLKNEIDAGINELVLDFANTRSLDSSAIGLLIATSNSLAATQGMIKVINVSPEIIKLLQSMRLIDRLHASAIDKGVPHG